MSVAFVVLQAVRCTILVIEGRWLVRLPLGETDTVVVDGMGLGGRGSLDGTVVATSGVGMIASMLCRSSASGCRRDSFVREVLVRERIDVLVATTIAIHVRVGLCPGYSLTVGNVAIVVSSTAAAAVVVRVIIALAVGCNLELTALGPEGTGASAIIAVMGLSRSAGSIVTAAPVPCRNRLGV